MKKETGDRVKLGMFVLTALGLFIFGIYSIGAKQRLFAKTFKVKALYRDVSGLELGNNVRFGGINIGTVNDIEILKDTVVNVEMVLDESVHQFIKSDALASITSEGLMGDKIVTISAGSSNQIVKDGQVLATIEGSSIDAILANLKIASNNAVGITNDLGDIISNVRAGKGMVGRILMDSVMGNDLRQTLRNVKGASKGLDDNLEAAKHSFLFKGYFKKKEKEAEKQAEAEKEKKEKDKEDKK
ncbi:MAG: MlaD family protein [Chitinophagales bacterium]